MTSFEIFQENIKRVLKKVCTVVPSKSFRRKCSERVDKDGDRLVDMLVKEQSGKIICAAMGFCAVSVNDYSDENELLSSDEFFSIQCVLCGKVMKKVKKEIGRESSRVRYKKQRSIQIRYLIVFLILIITRNTSKMYSKRHVQSFLIDVSEENASNELKKMVIILWTCLLMMQQQKQFAFTLDFVDFFKMKTL